MICSQLVVVGTYRVRFYRWLNLVEPREKGKDGYQNGTSRLTKVSARRLAATACMQSSVGKVQGARQVVYSQGELSNISLCVKVYTSGVLKNIVLANNSTL